MNLTYNGGSARLEVRLPDRWLYVMRGETVEVSEEEAARLLPMEGWQIAASEPTEEST